LTYNRYITLHYFKKALKAFGTFKKLFVIGIDLVNQSFLLVIIKRKDRERERERENYLG